MLESGPQPIAGPSVPRSLLVDSCPTAGVSYKFYHAEIQALTHRPQKSVKSPAPRPSQTWTTSPSPSTSSNQSNQHAKSKPCCPMTLNYSRLLPSPTSVHDQDSVEGPQSRLSPAVRHRRADHLISAPGVSFARSLSPYSSLHGTVRTTTIIHKSSKSNSPSSQKQLDLHTSPLNSSASQADSSASCLTRSGDTPTTPAPSLTHENHNSAPTSHPKPTQSKPKCWADLLRSGTSTTATASNGSPKSHYPKSPTSRILLNGGSSLPSEDTFPELADPRFVLLSDQLGALRHDTPSPALVPRGLINNGNICFANAILQVLVHCQPFYNLIRYLGRVLTHNFSSRTPLIEAMIAFIKEFRPINSTSNEEVRLAASGTEKIPPNNAFHVPADESFIAESVWIATKDNFRFDAMRKGQQEDAQEFLCFFLDTLHEELLVAIEVHDRLIRKVQKNHVIVPDQSAPHLSVDEVLNAADWLEVGSKGRPAVTRSAVSHSSPLSKIFELTTRSVLQRPGQKDSVTFEPNNMLQLSIEHPSITTIEQALAHFSAPDVISDMTTKTGQRMAATKQVYVETFPSVLVLHIKRFNYNSQDGIVSKSHKAVRFGTELKIPVSMRPPSQRKVANGTAPDVVFRLFAAVYHHGPSASGGHYTVSIRQQRPDRWIYIDDTYISTISPAAVVSPTSESPNSTPVFNNANGKLPGASTSRNLNSSNRTPYLLFYMKS